MTQRRSGAVAQWRSGAVAQWRSGAVAQWRSGAVAQWRSGAAAQWRSGAVAQWRSGAVARVSESQLREPGFLSFTAVLNLGQMFFTLHCSIYGGGYLCTNSLCVLIAASPDASPRSRDGVRLN